MCSIVGSTSMHSRRAAVVGRVQLRQGSLDQGSPVASSIHEGLVIEIIERAVKVGTVASAEPNIVAGHAFSMNAKSSDAIDGIGSWMRLSAPTT